MARYGPFIPNRFARARHTLRLLQKLLWNIWLPSAAFYLVSCEEVTLAKI